MLGHFKRIMPNCWEGSSNKPKCQKTTFFLKKSLPSWTNGMESMSVVPGLPSATAYGWYSAQSKHREYRYTYEVYIKKSYVNLYLLK